MSISRRNGLLALFVAIAAAWVIYDYRAEMSTRRRERAVITELELLPLDGPLTVTVWTSTSQSSLTKYLYPIARQRVVAIHLPTGGPLNATALSRLKELTDLRELHFVGGHFTDANVDGLDGLHDLRILSLDGETLSGIGIAKLARILPDLEELSIGWWRVQDKDVDAILALKNLASIDVSNTGLTSEGVRKAATSPNLRRLVIGRIEMTDLARTELSDEYPLLHIR